ncbi:hypothetical protein DRW07_17495 [Alteromonas sediminis]|uniref:FlgO domain-containing protein n=1 Tax=Alteromonas sediminis TaxID=2259342 RepID=A0A3N5Y961_9ALTE|nr:FlgO family outer membrane protein [Alteromonas sediminis]RPJ65105.1 hypothetical protein DRW07_17495 [Alteromonas sediminis]
MNQKFARYLLCAGVATLAACTTYDGEQAESLSAKPQLNVIDITTVDSDGGMHYSKPNYDQEDNFGAPGQPPLYSSVQGAYKGRPLTKHVGDYVQNLTQDLVSNMDYVTQKTPIGVTHFALLDSDLQQTNLLGRQMAESFMHEFHKFRIPVIDFKTTEYIRVTDQGDFVLTRDYLELDNAAAIQYVLTGTMAKHQGGYFINARLIGMQSRAVVASAQTLIPFYVVDAIIPSDLDSMSTMQDGIKLSQGE